MIRRQQYTVELSGRAAGQVMTTISSQLAVIKRYSTDTITVSNHLGEGAPNQCLPEIMCFIYYHYEIVVS